MKASISALLLVFLSLPAHAELGIYCTSQEGVQAKIVNDSADKNDFTMEVISAESRKFQSDEYSETKHQRFAFQEIAGQEFAESYSTDLVNESGTRYKAYLKLTRSGKGSLLSYQELAPITVRCVRGL